MCILYIFAHLSHKNKMSRSWPSNARHCVANTKYTVIIYTCIPNTIHIQIYSQIKKNRK